MVTVGLFIRIEAKPDRAPEVEAMLKSAFDQVRDEKGTPVWFALRFGPTTFGVFDAFADDDNRQAHLEANGEALNAAGAELFVGPPSVEHLDVIAAKLPR